MRRFPLLAFVLVSLLGATVAVRALAQNAGGNSPQNNGGGQGGGPQGQRGPGGQGGPGGGPPPPGFHLIPRFAEEKLDLTDDQQQQIQQLEQETKAKLAKILTPAQMQILETARPPRRGGGPGQNGGGQGGGSGDGGPGGGGPADGGPGGGGQGGGNQSPPN